MIHHISRRVAPQATELGIVCSDYDAVIARLGAHGHAVDPRRAHWGSPRAYVSDPAGNLLEVVAWPPSETSGSTGR